MKPRSRDEILADIKKLVPSTDASGEEDRYLRSDTNEEGFYVEHKDPGKDYKNTLFGFELSMLPGCCGVGVVHDLVLNPPSNLNARDKNKLLRLVTEFQAAAVRDKGYTYAMQTHVVANKIHQSRMKTSKLDKIALFKNARTGAKVTVHGIDVRK